MSFGQARNVKGQIFVIDVKIKDLHSLKDTIKRMKRQAVKWVMEFAKHSGKWVIFTKFIFNQIKK